MAEINQTAAEKMYTVSSRETIYEGNGKDTDVNPLCDSDTWYEGAGRVEALRTVREYTADVRHGQGRGLRAGHRSQRL